MKPTRSRSPLRLRGTIFALALAATATQVGGAAAASREAGVSAAVLQSVAILPLVGERELLAALANHARPPGSGSWALLLAGLTGAFAIGRRRVSAIGGRIVEPQGPPRR